MTGARQLRLAVIGAGASGLMALIRLREAGFQDVTIYEKAETLGGTWRDNRYPGVTCDVPSHGYRYSFEPNAEWSRVCAPGDEILDYLKNVARKYDLERSIRFGEEVSSTRWCDGRWEIETTSGPQGAFDAVVTATGVLHHPNYPDIPGIDTFEGDAVSYGAMEGRSFAQGKARRRDWHRLDGDTDYRCARA